MLMQKLARQIGGEAPGVSTRYAKNAAIGKLGGMSSHRMKGSMEGLITYKNTVLEGAGNGYSNPAVQTARYNPKSLGIPSSNHGTLVHGSNASHSATMGFLPSKYSSAARINR